MASKRKKQKKSADVESTLLDELAQKLKVPDDIFDGDIDDECDSDAKIIAKNVKGSVLLEKLEFLLDHGWHAARLKEIIEDSSDES